MILPDEKDRAIYLLLGLLLSFCIGAGIFVFIVYKPFFWSAFLSLILYIGTRDYYIRLKNILPEKAKNFAPVIMSIVILVLFILPLTLIIINLLQEFLTLLFILKVNLSEEKLIPFLMNFSILTDYFTDTEFFWVNVPNIYKEIVSTYGDILNVDSLYGIMSNATSLILGGLKIPLEIAANVLFTFALLFFLHKDGYKLEEFLMQHLPVSGELKQKIGYRLLDSIKAVLKGNLVISILQGVVLGILLASFGIPSPILYGIVGSFFSLIPVIGTGVVWLPAGAYIWFGEGNIIQSIVFMSLAVLSYLVLENFVKPSILDKKLNLHPFLLFLSLLGGIQEFGIVGLIIGPVAVTSIVILWDFWMDYRKGLNKDLQEERREII
ncbi:MAG: AI-2E family transporter [Leptospiraceae bacterium]|nr:AI-2E family transporter [Leptospiraceae bacterium]